jgi:biotin carboxylase
MDFRDGRRNVPEYLAILLGKIEVYRYTYDEAIALANRALEGLNNR